MHEIVKGLTVGAWEEEMQHLDDAIVVLQGIRQSQIMANKDSDFIDIASRAPMLVRLLIMKVIEFGTEVSSKPA